MTNPVKKYVTAAPKPKLATITVCLMLDGSMTVSVDSCQGITARKVDSIAPAIWLKVMQMRAEERHKISMKTKRVADATKEISNAS